MGVKRDPFIINLILIRNVFPPQRRAVLKDYLVPGTRVRLPSSPRLLSRIN